MMTLKGVRSRRRVLIGAGTLGAVWAVAKINVAQALGARPITWQTFRPLLNQEFLVVHDDTQAVLKLVEVSPLQRGKRPAQLPNPFSLVFRSSADLPPLPAQIYEVEHARLGRLAMFITPITGDPSFYEAAFN
jgi:uncharacterized protein DUF6916